MRSSWRSFATAIATAKYPLGNKKSMSFQYVFLKFIWEGTMKYITWKIHFKWFEVTDNIDICRSIQLLRVKTEITFIHNIELSQVLIILIYFSILELISDIHVDICEWILDETILIMIILTEPIVHGLVHVNSVRIPHLIPHFNAAMKWSHCLTHSNEWIFEHY